MNGQYSNQFISCHRHITNEMEICFFNLCTRVCLPVLNHWLIYWPNASAWSHCELNLCQDPTLSTAAGYDESRGAHLQSKMQYSTSEIDPSIPPSNLSGHHCTHRPTQPCTSLLHILLLLLNNHCDVSTTTANGDDGGGNSGSGGGGGGNMTY